MSDLFPPVARPSARNAFTGLAPRIAAVAVLAFLSLLTLSSPVVAQAPPPVPAPNPAFPVGRLAATFTIIQAGGAKPTLQWSAALPANANTSDYTFFIRQRMNPMGIEYDMQVESEGEGLAAFTIGTYNTSTFEFWAVNVTTARSYLLDTITAGALLPRATVAIRTEDRYAALPRTRADRPIYVDYTVTGLGSDPGYPDSLKGVNLLRHVQSYGATGTGDGLDRTQATLLSQTSVTSDGTQTATIAINEIPGANRAKVRGEERFSLFSQPVNFTDPGSGTSYSAPPFSLDSQFVQIWPVADGSINGISQGQILGTGVPVLTFQVNDLYPDSFTWAQVYQGGPQDGVTGAMVPGSGITLNDSVPADRIVTLQNYGALFTSDGLWTMELLTRTPFGTDRLARVSFIVRQSGMTIAEWRQNHFSDPSNSGDGADENDFDKDGLANVIEFAFGLDPKQPGTGPLPVAERNGDEFGIRFTPPAGIAGIRYGAEWSATLAPGSWLPLVNTGELPEHVFNVSTTGKPHLYLRLTAEAP